MEKAQAAAQTLDDGTKRRLASLGDYLDENGYRVDNLRAVFMFKTRGRWRVEFMYDVTPAGLYRWRINEVLELRRYASRAKAEAEAVSFLSAYALDETGISASPE